MKLTAVVTGASSGIGAATARSLARRGFSVAISARGAERLEEIAGECRREGVRIVPVQGDMTRRADVEKLREAAFASFGGVFAWINNAGRGIAALVEETTEEELDSMLAVNLKSAFFGIQAILPHFKERGTGVIVNVGSILSRVPSLYRGAYCASKHALLGLSGCLRQELVAQGFSGISVSTVIPGPVDSGGNDVDAKDRAMARVRKRFLPDSAYAGWLTLQSSETIAEIIVDAIDHPRPEIFTSSSLRAHALAFAEDPERRENLMAPVAEMIFEGMTGPDGRAR